ncbi:putative protein kinase RLK-Pelle-LRR-XII-1 family [Helianthus anomalus]
MNSKQPIVCLSSLFSHIHLIFYTLVIFLTSTTISVGQNETDHQALLNIKLMITHDPYGALTSWNNSMHFCDWVGVTCGKRHRRVTYLRLISQGLEGSLSPHVGNLSFLHGLSLSNNSFQGAIPHELGRLSRLLVLSVGTNKFSGVIPANISGCSNLVVIGLAKNELVGSIPKEISFLPELSFLLLQNNKLTGGISPFLGNITTMVVFGTHGNPLGGSIPDTLSHWKHLEEIYCSHCNLSGTIAPMYNLSLLTEVRFTNNQLTGSLPLALGTMLSQLVSLYLWGNQLTGPLPPTISNCSRLSDLQMNKNKFSGKLMIDFSKLRDIYFITIGSNNFGSKEVDEMKFIKSLENCTKLKYLDISDCNFQGVLPSSIGNLSDQLSYLSLELNQLHGNLPLSIGNLAGVSSLYFATNHFTGSIPSTIGNLQKLQVLDLQKNQLLGRIPDTIGNLSLLITLSLSSNKLEGAIPSSLGNCRRLLELDLGDNRLTGKIPTQLLKLSSLSKTLNLSQNNLFGSLPMEVGYLKMLSTLDLSYNNLSGNIPSGLGDCGSLTRLILKGNLFQGIMPSSLSSLKGLLELDISYNNLSGQIPKFLERLKLEHLNLSYNDFEGKVPMLGVFSNESAFSVFGNSWLCGGLTELGLRRCKEMKKQTKRFPLFVIVILVASTLFTIICLACVCCKRKIKRQLSQSSKSSGFLKVSYKQLFKATNGFSEANLIGNGGFSSVYKGILNEDDDRFVAIKVLHLQNRGAQRSFTRECEVWRNIRHRNLLRVITSCSSVDFQGNDFKALILMDVACALDYIHNQCIPAVVHGDLKPSNILLDDDMVAHIGDFGLARFLGTTSYQTNSTMNRGTIGYIAPEYGIGNEMTSCGDIYSFGILLLEVMTGKKPTDNIFQDGLSLHKFASMSLPDHVTNVIDVNIVNTYQEKEKLKECLASTIKIGVSCSLDSPQKRIDIKNVVRELLHILNALQDI